MADRVWTWGYSRAGAWGGPRGEYDQFEPKVVAVTVTSRTDRDGATVRPSALIFMHATASARNADLVGADEMQMDRFVARSLRVGHQPTASEDTRLRTYAFSLRAGDAYAVRGLLLRLHPSPRPTIHVADTTNRTDRDGTTARVPTWGAYAAADSSLNSSLAAGSTYRDRFRTERLYPSGDTVGHVHRLQFRTDGRAGSTSAPLEVLVHYNPSYVHTHKAAAT